MIIRSKDTSLSFEIDDYQYPEHKSQEKGTITTQTGSKLLFNIIDMVTVHTDGRMTFKFQGGKTRTSY